MEPDDDGLGFGEWQKLVKRQCMDYPEIVGLLVEIYWAEDVAHVVELYVSEALQ